jgi:hypothetical protein
MVRSDPAVDNYTTSKYQLEALRRDRVQLENVIRSVAPTTCRSRRSSTCRP